MWADPAVSHVDVRSVDGIITAIANQPAAETTNGLVAPAGSRPSAVLVVLGDGAQGPQVLLTKRSRALRHHAGEVSFPGGRVDDGESYAAAALREAHEEVGLRPDRVDVVGMLAPIVVPVSNSFVVPIVARTAPGWAASELSLTVPTDEVDRVMWTPLTTLVQPGRYREEVWSLPNGERGIVFFELDDETVWGATARILLELVHVAINLVRHGPPRTRTAE